MRKVISIITIAGAALLVGCAHGPKVSQAPVKVGTTPLWNDVDTVSPATIQENDKPVYVMPEVVTGWQKGRTDDKTGTWYSGRYVGIVRSPGYWTNQQEAERSGRPYMTMDGSSKIVPGDVQDQGKSNPAGNEFDVAALNRRLDKVEADKSNEQGAPVSEESAADMATTVNGMVQYLNPAANQDRYTEPNYGNFSPGLAVDGAVPVNPTPAATDDAPDKTRTVLTLRPRAAGEVYQVPVPDLGNQPITVSYTSDRTVTISYGHQTTDEVIVGDKKEVDLDFVK